MPVALSHDLNLSVLHKPIASLRWSLFKSVYKAVTIFEKVSFGAQIRSSYFTLKVRSAVLLLVLVALALSAYLTAILGMAFSTEIPRGLY